MLADCTRNEWDGKCKRKIGDHARTNVGKPSGPVQLAPRTLMKTLNALLIDRDSAFRGMLAGDSHSNRVRVGKSDG